MKTLKKVLLFAGVMSVFLGVMSGCSNDNNTTPVQEVVIDGAQKWIDGDILEYENDIFRVAFDNTYFALEESGDSVIFTTEEENAVVEVISYEAKAFISEFTSSMLDSQTTSEDLYKLLFAEFIAQYYGLTNEDEFPLYIVNGMRTSNLDKPVNVCEAIFFVNAYNDFPATKFDIKISGSDDSGAIIKIIYETSLENEQKDEPLSEIAQQMYGLKDSIGLKLSADENLTNEESAEEVEVDYEVELEITDDSEYQEISD